MKQHRGSKPSVASFSYEQKNRDLVEEFIRQLPSLSTRRIAKYRHRMHCISVDLGKPFDQVTKDDLRLYVQQVNDRPNYTDWIRLDYRIFIKKFFAWMHDREWVSWIRLGRVKAAAGWRTFSPMWTWI